MQDTIGTYTPFLHDNFEYKKYVIDLARKQAPTFEGIHVATLIYVNAIDYIAQHILEHLTKITYISTYHRFNGVVFRVNKFSKGQPLGLVMRQLDNYEFPDKNEFMRLLKQFKTTRNRILHNLLSLTQSELKHLDKDFNDIRETAEELLSRYDAITRGITSAWNMESNHNSSKIDQSTSDKVVKK